MKAILGLWVICLWLLSRPIQAQQGLKGDYYTGTNFERKVFTRIDPKISFDWTSHNPGSGIPHSYYSIRWTGKLLAPISGQYTFNAKVDDGIRIWVGNKKVVDAWYLNDSNNFAGSIILEAGKYYDLRVDYFNDMMGGEIELFWRLPNAPKLVLTGMSNRGEPITAQYLFQKAPPVIVAPPKPAPIVVKTPPPPVSKHNVVPPIAVNAQKTAPKPVLVKVAPIAPPKPISTTVILANTPAITPASPPPPDFKSGETVVLHQVQFEQSSYVLLPESAAELNKLVAALKANPLWDIDVAGHTDNVGDPRLNLALSENRAKVVTNYLIRHGIAENRLTATGYGGTRPIADNTTEGERSKNRRVEITIR